MNQVVILAAGKGSRMQSDLPKVLHTVNGAPILEHVVRSARKVSPNVAIIVGHKGETIKRAMGDDCEYIWQHEQLGTGHAIKCAKEALSGRSINNVFVLPGDHPLISSVTLEALIENHNRKAAVVSLATVRVPAFTGSYSVFSNCGRVLRNSDGEITGIVEFKDATEAEQRITELNVSFYCFNAEWLWNNIELLSQNNKASEFYITDLVALAAEQGHYIASHPVQSLVEGMGVNTREQLEMVQKQMAAEV